MTIEVVSPFPVEALPRVWWWIESFRGRVLDDYGPQTLEAWVEKALQEKDRLTTWAVYRDGELGGMVSFERWTPVLGVGHCLFKKQCWGWKTTLPALRQIAQEIFDSGIQKICMVPFSDNKAVISLLKQLGAVVEGYYSRHTLRNGALVSMTALALFKEEFERASTSNCSGDRRGLVDPRRGPGGQEQENGQHDHADLVSRDAAAPGSTQELQLVPAD